MHESYKKWLDDGCPKVYCGCSCHGEIVITKYHGHDGIPKYMRGHQPRIHIIPESYQKWLDNDKPKVFCECPCHGEIIIKNHHKRFGIPKYINGHSKRGKHLTEETKQKIRMGNIGKIMSEETKQKLRDANVGKKHTEETIQKCSGENNSMFGKRHTEETRQKMRDNRPDYSGENHPNWQGGISKLPYCEKWIEELREEIREQYGRKCYICERNEKDNIYKNGKQIKLSVHHVDSDKEQGCNGKSWKLVPLCIHCHGSKKCKVLK